MKLPVHVQFSGMEPFDALEASARDHAHKLKSVAADIMACRVAIDLEQKHQHQGRPLGVRIDLTLPGLRFHPPSRWQRLLLRPQ